MNVQAIYNSKILKKGLEFAARKNALFVASASLVMSTVARPVAIMATPDTDIENKRYACAKSIASSAAGYLIMLAASLPVSKAIENINKKPSKYLSENTRQFLKTGEKSLSKSKRFAFATQLFDLGLGFIIAVPKSLMTCALIPPLMSKMFTGKQKKQKEKKYIIYRNTRSSVEKLSKGIGKLINTNFVKKMSKKYCNTNFEQHIMSLTDAVATGAFISFVSKDNKIEQDRKKALMYNAGISTGLCIAGGYGLNSILKKPTERFIENFRKANKNSPKLEEYIKGIRIAKPALILGSIYYILIPLISTFVSDKLDKKQF